LEARQRVTGQGPQAAPQRVVHEAVRVRTELQWGPRGVVDVRNVGLWPGKGREKWSQSRGGHVGASGKTMWVESPSPLELVF
jgi:hypothetical protein